MLLLAGTSEAGKSSAGEYLATLGARRIKIRTILVRLSSGRETHHEGVQTREGFEYGEFIARLLESGGGEGPLAIESFIDVALADRVKQAWPARCAIMFITAPLPVRVRRLAEASGISAAAAQRVIRSKDERKRVNEQLSTWRVVTDYWIDNSADIVTFRTRVREAYESLQTTAGGTQP
ncbi:hypothetical protein E0H26_19860 [Micromonospora zingiberis]|uniref:Guanylate kinase-like domain-containing protein n=1 Tax=Micromonospora zingiberis TaxID=2053011 RepID=A0A4R0GFQ6_9ACTN|nr:hypothetical protein [Micromonospora zingiberis]TCB95447.1 hypothetical protein E0H26_19860 [Micromonospora zingiberis]